MAVDPLKSHIRDWQEMATVDPFQAISGQKYQRNLEGFFASARPHMDQVFSIAASVGFPKSFDRALEFGCGVGRFLPHFEQRFREVWGIDISPKMIDLAAKNNPDCKFHLNTKEDLGVFPDRHFDFVYSFLVLQHLPNESIIVRYVEEFVRILKPGGLAVFQVPDHLALRWRVQPRRRIYRLLRMLGVKASRLQAWNLLPMKFTSVSAKRIKSTVSAAGGKIVKEEDLGPPEGVMYYTTR